MTHTLAAAVLTAAILPLGALDAAAAPATSLGKTYQLQCNANGFDGTALKARMMVKNTTGRVIAKGTKITLRITYRYMPGARWMAGRAQTQITYRDVGVNDSIGFDKPAGATRCTATVTLRPNIKVTR
jgi:hypothetical protein